MNKPTTTIRFSTDKNGRARAHYWGAARRWLAISVAKADLMLATGAAVMNETTSSPLPSDYRQTSVDGDIWAPANGRAFEPATGEKP